MNVVITGASRGIGKAIAEVYAQHGYDLFLCARNESALFQTAEALRTAYPNVKVQAQAFDLGRKEEAQLFGQWIVSAADTIDVLVNNAGSFVGGTIAEAKEGVLESMLEINLLSAYYVTREVLPKMIAAKTGHIFNMCSTASLEAYTAGSAYSISKFALYGFTKNLRQELIPHQVKVTAVMPGAVFTDSWKGSDVKESRIMTPQDIASMIYATSRLSPQATVEEVILRPQLGDL